MKSIMLAVTVAVLGLFGTQTVMAQAAPAKTRAEVKAECEAAKKAGQIVSGECQQIMATKATSTTTRAEVKAEGAAAKKAGTVVSGEAKGPGPATKAMPTKTRAEVKADCEAARKAGKIVEGDCKPCMQTVALGLLDYVALYQIFDALQTVAAPPLSV